MALMSAGEKVLLWRVALLRTCSRMSAVASRRLPHHMEGSCSAKPGCRDMMGASLLG